MKVMMRLYRQHDLDLIYLYKLKGFSFQNAIKSSIRACIRNKHTPIPTPLPTQPLQEIILPKSVHFHIYLSPKTDSDIIEWINKISKGYRNSALKNVLRAHIDYPALYPYGADTTVIFKSGKIQKINLKDKEIYRKKEKHENDSVDVAAILAAPLPKGDENAEMRVGDEVLSEMFESFQKM